MDAENLIKAIHEYIDKFSELHNDKFNKYPDKIIFDFQELSELNFELAESLLDNPEQTMIAFRRVISKEPRFKNVNKSQIIPLNKVREIHLDKYIGVEGIIRFAGKAKILIESIVFQCSECGNEQIKLQIGKNIKKLTMCRHCGSKSLKLKKENRTNLQRLLLEEPLETVVGNNPTSIHAILKKDLLDPELNKIVIPGNKVILWGVLKTNDPESKETEVEFLFDTNYIEVVEELEEEVNLLPADIEKIKIEGARPDFLNKMLDSFAPHIYGMRHIKKALILQALSGKKVVKSGKTDANLLHVLLIGDPGVAKTEVAKSIKQIVPKYRYANGTAATAVGLLASADKDEFFGGWVIKAGAIVMAHNGILNIDEFDKMEENTQKSLNEAMSEYTISKDAGGVHAVLKCETKVLAVANPKHGRFDANLDVASQINLDKSLLSRFDLIYVIKDIPGQDDIKIAHKMIDSMFNNEQFLGDDSNESSTLYTPSFMKKYVSFAKNIKIVGQTAQSAKYIAEKFAALRMTANQNERITITKRQFNAMLKLSIAFARLRLSTTVELIDAENAFQTVIESLEGVALDPQTGQLDIDAVMLGSFASDRKIHNYIRELFEKNDELTTEDIKNNLLVEVSDVKLEQLLEKMSSKGDIYQPKSGFVQLI